MSSTNLSPCTPERYLQSAPPPRVCHPKKTPPTALLWILHENPRFTCTDTAKHALMTCRAITSVCLGAEVPPQQVVPWHRNSCRLKLRVKSPIARLVLHGYKCGFKPCNDVLLVMQCLPKPYALHLECFDTRGHFAHYVENIVDLLPWRTF